MLLDWNHENVARWIQFGISLEKLMNWVNLSLRREHERKEVFKREIQRVNKRIKLGERKTNKWNAFSDIFPSRHSAKSPHNSIYNFGRKYSPLLPYLPKGKVNLLKTCLKVT
jgi:hypothetical protein